MKVRDVLKRLKENGWYQARQQGSHRILVHDEKAGHVTVAGHPSDEMDPGTLNNVWKQAGLKG